MRTSAKLSPLQLELLKVYSFQPTEEELLEIKQYLARFFSKRLIKHIDEAAQKTGITESDLDQWLNGNDQ